MLTDRDQALARLREMIAADIDPPFDEDEVGALLDDQKFCSVWEPNFDYAIGDKVVPVSGNGHFYAASSKGTSGSSEPDWPVRVNAQVEEGPSSPQLHWTESGVAPQALWNLRRAAEIGWRIRAGKLTERITFSTGTKSYQQKEQFEMCLKMADRYRSIMIV